MYVNQEDKIVETPLSISSVFVQTLLHMIRLQLYPLLVYSRPLYVLYMPQHLWWSNAFEYFKSNLCIFFWIKDEIIEVNRWIIQRMLWELWSEWYGDRSVIRTVAVRPSYIPCCGNTVQTIPHGTLRGIFMWKIRGYPIIWRDTGGAEVKFLSSTATRLSLLYIWSAHV